jgi:hypothetical protein
MTSFWSEPGQLIELTIKGNRNPVRLRAVRYGDLFPDHALLTQQLPPGGIDVGAAVYRMEPHRLFAKLRFANPDSASTFNFDRAKIFLLDGQGRQLQRWTPEEVDYAIESRIAQYFANYPQPMPIPPSTRYTITATETGSYSLITVGNMGTISGSSVGTYSVNPQIDLAQSYAIGYNLGLAFRNIRDQRQLAKLRNAQQWWRSAGLKGNPVLPGENRVGDLSFISNGPAVGPFKLLMFVNDSTGAQKLLTFRFQ